MDTKITPKMLCLLLCQAGYTVTLRCLRDWRAKGLLPRLQRQGLGKGKGSLWFWTERDILKRAVAVCRKIRETRRTSAAVIETWFGGAPHSIGRVRRAWISEISRRHSNSRAIQNVAGTIARNFGWNSAFVADYIREFVNPLFIRNYSIGKNFDIAIIVEFLDRNFWPKIRSGKISPETVTSFYAFLRAFAAILSPVGFYELLNSATDSEIEAARELMV